MKKNSVSLIVILFITFAGCKKNTNENTTIADPPTEKKWVVTTLAGTGEASFVNGPVISATFHFPGDVAVNANGEVFVTDLLNF